MKKILVGVAVIILTTQLKAQDPVTDVFNQFEGKDGYTTVNVTGDLFEMLSQIEKEGEEKKDLVTKIEELKILTLEDSLQEVNFHDLVYDKLNKSDYKELVVVRGSGQDVDIMAKEQDGVITEFLLIASGHDNALISIKGRILLEELDDLGESVNIEGLERLEMMEENKD